MSKKIYKGESSISSCVDSSDVTLSLISGFTAGNTLGVGSERSYGQIFGFSELSNRSQLGGQSKSSLHDMHVYDNGMSTTGQYGANDASRVVMTGAGYRLLEHVNGAMHGNVSHMPIHRSAQTSSSSLLYSSNNEYTAVNAANGSQQLLASNAHQYHPYHPHQLSDHTYVFNDYHHQQHHHHSHNSDHSSSDKNNSTHSSHSYQLHYNDYYNFPFDDIGTTGFDLPNIPSVKIPSLDTSTELQWAHHHGSAYAYGSVHHHAHQACLNDNTAIAERYVTLVGDSISKHDDFHQQCADNQRDEAFRQNIHSTSLKPRPGIRTQWPAGLKMQIQAECNKYGLRATADKYNINRRQVQRWRQCPRLAELAAKNPHSTRQSSTGRPLQHKDIQMYVATAIRKQCSTGDFMDYRTIKALFLLHTTHMGALRLKLSNGFINAFLRRYDQTYVLNRKQSA